MRAGPSVRAQDEGGRLIPTEGLFAKLKGQQGLSPNQEKILHSSNTSKATCKARMCHTACGTDENEQK